MRLTDVANVTNGKIYGDCEFSGYAIDSRKVEKGNMFVCLRGEKTDGHNYIDSAKEMGAVCFLSDRVLNTDVPYLLVEDTLKALQNYAAFIKEKSGIKLVAVTGSVGKTTTKECIYSVLQTKFKTHKTQGNMNSETGLPLTLLSIEKDDKIAVTELGMSAKGEIEVLSEIAKPDVALITNIGLSHIEYLGSQENILQAKLEILIGLKDSGILILNYDDEYLHHAYNDLLCDIPQKIIRYGINCRGCDVFAHDIVMEDGCLRFLAITPQGECTIVMPCEGIHNVYNSLAAICVGLSFGLTLKQIGKGLAKFKNVPLRQQSYEKDGFFIIEDCYNASPASMKAATDVLKTKTGRKIVVLGDMGELGSFGPELHAKTGEMLDGIDILIAFGEISKNYINGAILAGLKTENCYHCENSIQAGKILRMIARKGDNILIKASRFMCGENVAKSFYEKKDGLK